MAFSAALKKQFKVSRQAWKFFDAQPEAYKRRLTHWVMSAKQDVTRQKRLEQLIAASAEELKMA